ncbi:hypothetical protein NLO98_08200 [Pseudomonas syringae]|nr:hypothetical protein [Pseudomonas syringae]
MSIQFQAFDQHQNITVIVDDKSEDSADGSGRVTHWGLSTLGGRQVIRESKGVYRIQGGTTLLKSSDPNAP